MKPRCFTSRKAGSLIRNFIHPCQVFYDLTNRLVNNSGQHKEADDEAFVFIHTHGFWAINPDGSKRRSLATGTDSVMVTNPVWSPDGSQIAYLKIIITPQEDFEVTTQGGKFL